MFNTVIQYSKILEYTSILTAIYVYQNRTSKLYSIVQ